MKYLKSAIYIALPALLLFCQCQPGNNADNTNTTDTTAQKTNEEQTIPEPPPQPNINYRFASKDSIKKISKAADSNQLHIITAINRVDNEHLPLLDSALVPDQFTDNILDYSPFPLTLPYVQKVNKIIFFSYTIQAFGAYEHGKLILWGPTNMGRKDKPTPTGLFFTNWKAEETKSTFDDEWVLKWNFNIDNKEGVGFHQYALPGYPASHSCLRLQENDAKYLYNWAEQWVMKGKDEVKAQGTPVVVFGAYPFGTKERPWYTLAADGKSTNITRADLQKQTEAFLENIMSQQQRRDSVATN